MAYHLAQLNIARFHLPKEHPINKDFVDNLDRVNAIAERQEGFIWRLVGDGDNATDIQAFDDPKMIVNMSVWASMESLSAFVYRNKEHRSIMRRREEWFEEIEFYLVLWWVKTSHTPSLKEAKEKLTLLQENGPSANAFTFKAPFACPQ